MSCCDELLAESFFRSKLCRTCLWDESWVTCISHFWCAPWMLLIKTWITNFTPVCFPFQGRNCMHCIIRWIRQPKSHFPSEKTLRVKRVWASRGILTQVSKAKVLLLRVDMWLCFLITRLQFLPVWSFFNLQTFSSTSKVLTCYWSQRKY